MPAQREIEKALAGFVRRHPKEVELSPLEVLEVVTRHDFKCRICNDPLAAQRRSVLHLEDGEGLEVGGLIAVCDPCRLTILKQKASGS
jgi:hypothetical protein